MTKLLPLFIAALLSGCLALPGSEGKAPERFALQGLAQECVPGNRTIAVSVAQVAAGLNTDRIARIQDATGDFSSSVACTGWIAPAP